MNCQCYFKIYYELFVISYELHYNIEWGKGDYSMNYYSDMEQRQIISDNLKLLIDGSGKDQKTVAIDLEVNPPTFNQWVMGKAIPQIHMLRKIAQYFHVKLTDIIDPKESDDTLEDICSLPGKYAREYSELDDERKKVIHNTIDSEYRMFKEKIREYQRVMHLEKIDNINDAKIILGNAAAFGGDASEEELILMANAVKNSKLT